MPWRAPYYPIEPPETRWPWLNRALRWLWPTEPDPTQLVNPLAGPAGPATVHLARLMPATAGAPLPAWARALNQRIERYTEPLLSWLRGYFPSVIGPWEVRGRDLALAVVPELGLGPDVAGATTFVHEALTRPAGLVWGPVTPAASPYVFVLEGAPRLVPLHELGHASRPTSGLPTRNEAARVLLEVLPYLRREAELPELSHLTRLLARDPQHGAIEAEAMRRFYEAAPPQPPGLGRFFGGEGVEPRDVIDLYLDSVTPVLERWAGGP